MSSFKAFPLGDHHRMGGDRRLRRWLTFSLAVFAALILGSQVVTAETLYVVNFFDPPSAGRIERVTADGTRQVVREVGAGLRAIAVDVSSNSLFWSDVDSDRIERVDLKAASGASSGVVTTGLDFPQDLDLSVSAGKLFWAEPGLERVEASNLDGTARSVLFSAITVAIGVDEVNGKIYSEDRTTSSIVRSNFDGTEFQEIIRGVPIANDIAIDSLNEVIYWTSSGGLVDGNGGVYRVDFDGTDFAEIFVMGSNLDTFGIALDSSNGKLYFGQEVGPSRSDIYRMNLDGSDPEVVATGFGLTVHMALVPDQPTPVTIDIKPGDKHNVLNPRSHGRVSVAVLSDTDNETAFDPLQIDIATVRFGPDGATPNRYHVRDVNKDGLGDLLVQFRIPDTGIQCGDRDVTLTGSTFDGREVNAADSMKTVGCRRHR